MLGPTDHRLRTLAARSRWRAPLGPGTRAAMDAVWDDLTGGAAGETLTLALKGRTIALPRFARGVGRADFDTLCAKPLGPADYLAVARAVETLILDDVPLLGRARHDAARRFVMLIDVLYEAKRRLIVSAEAEPSALYPEGDGAFEFARTVSRLEEMRSEAWGVPG
jgi:cell division protein ZapE